MDNRKIEKFIQEHRKEKNMTQKELADKLFVTDKAVSKWERGLSFPDITIINKLSEILEVNVSELLNGERSIIKYNKKIKKIFFIASLIIFVLSFFLQFIYIFKLQKLGLSYTIDYLFYIINELIVLSLFYILYIFKKNIRIKNIIVIIIGTIITIINIFFLINNGLKYKCYFSISNDFSRAIVVKKNKVNGETKIYRTKYLLFSKEKETLSYAVDSSIKIQWIEDDICSITYFDSDNNLKEYVETYGNRSKRLDYYYVASSLYGVWQSSSRYGININLTIDSKGITIEKDTKEFFSYNDTKQFGTIALVLYRNDVPKYIISMNKNAKLEEKSKIIDKGGNISLTEISIGKTKTYSFDCMSDKNNLSKGNYNIVNMAIYSYKIENDTLYIRYNDDQLVEVPGDFTNTRITNKNHSISTMKTYFLMTSSSGNYLVYSDDSGKKFEKVKLSSNSEIVNIQFLNTNDGYILEYTDAALGGARYGYIKKTEDGGKTWNNIGVGPSDGFRDGSELYFINNDLGFLTIPRNGESSQLYVTRDSGKTFSLVKIDNIDNSIYDYYNIPTVGDKSITIEISQGSDGDYNGGESIKYISLDNGITWNKKD